MYNLPKPIWQTSSALVLSGMILSAFTPLVAVEPTHPLWWGDRNVTNGNAVQNKGVAQIGQLKYMATQAHAELEALLPGGAGFDLPFSQPPANPDAAWYQNQKKALNLGQLKAVAKPFYDRVNEVTTLWPLAQMQTNGLANLGEHYFQGANGNLYPWNPATPVAENYKPASVGQLKLVFALRFRYSDDGDAAPDLMELAVFGDTDEVITVAHDTNADGFVDYAELINGYGLPGVDTDMDGTTDLVESPGSGRDPDVKDHPAVGLSVVIGN